MECRQFDIYLVNLDPTIGSEQGKTRPVLVISATSINKIMPIINILPITSKKQGRYIYPNEVEIKKEISNLYRTSIIMSHQIRTIDKKRLIKKLGKINDEKPIKQIYNSLLFQIGYKI